MKKRILILTLLLSYVHGLSQENKGFFSLYENKNQYEISKCINQDSDFKGLEIILIDDTPESFKNAKLIHLNVFKA